VTALPQDPATALPGWTDLPDGLTAAGYEALPEDICRRIEIVDGAIIVNARPAPPAPGHLPSSRQCPGSSMRNPLTVSTDMDLRLRDIPLLNRRPDAVIYDASLPDDEVTADQTDKPAECAASRIPNYWRVEHDTAEQALSVFCYRLDPTTSTYASAGIHTGKMTVTEPVTITIDLSTLL
jgi:hypothetical protein